VAIAPGYSDAKSGELADSFKVIKSKSAFRDIDASGEDALNVFRDVTTPGEDAHDRKRRAITIR
jgi:hypothetical protein